MSISVIICTYNRCESLKDTLNSLIDQECDGRFDYEVIVIDNNSNDNTKGVVESFSPTFNGKLRYLFEPKQGKPYALNLGIKEAKGEIIAFTDDDCIVDSAWLLNIKKSFTECETEIGIVGGKVFPLWLTNKRPGWLKEYFFGPLGVLDWGETSFLINKSSKLFFGNNFAFKKDLFDKYNNFDNKMINAHDTEICLRFLRNGIKGFYNPNMKVSHKISAGRLTPRYFYKWFYKRGKFSNYIEEFKIKDKPKFYYPFGIPIWLIRRFLKEVAKSFLASSAYFKTYYRCRCFYYLGTIASILNERHKLANSCKTQTLLV